MFDKKEKSPPKKKIFDVDEVQEATKRLDDAPPAKVMCNCRKQIIDPTPKGKACSYCGGLVG